MTDEVKPDIAAYPDIRDPRVMVAVPRDRRVALSTLWAFAERLTKLLRDTREPLIGQIKLAWWRDMAGLLATDAAALPKGEPLLAELQQSWAGQTGLDRLVDAAEAMLLAEAGDARRDAAMAFGGALFALSAGHDEAATGGRRWGLLWGAGVQAEEDGARRLYADARGEPVPSRPSYPNGRAFLMLDRWAAAIVGRDGERRWRSEGLLLFRMGLLGR